MALPRPPPAAIPTKLSALDFQRALVLCVGLDNGIKAFLPLKIIFCICTRWYLLNGTFFYGIGALEEEIQLGRTEMQ